MTGLHTQRRHQALVVAATLVVVAGAAIRLALLPTEGLRGDMDQFAVWISHIATAGLPNAYDADLAFGPVMAYVWSLLGAIEPGFQRATDASDPGLRVLMKLPAVLADFGLAAGVGYALRARPGWAVLAAGFLLLVPATWYVSAWWGQYESICVLAGLGAVLFATNGRDGLAAGALAVAVMTKPQAAPFVVPFIGWFVARGGLKGLARAAIAGGLVGLVLWLPFLMAGGPGKYLANIAAYQNDVFSVLSLRAWNVWWLLQEFGTGGDFASDRVTIIGPISFRVVGFVITGLLSIVIAYRVWRDPRPRTLIVGLAAATLVAFTFLTTMHERYAYSALVFLLLLLPDRRVRWLALAFGVVFTFNLVAAIPATTELAGVLSASRALAILGSVAMVLIVLRTMSEMRTRESATG